VKEQAVALTLLCALEQKCQQHLATRGRVRFDNLFIT
jgi:hypothetical protein